MHSNEPVTTFRARHHQVRTRVTRKVGGESGLGYLAVIVVVLLWGCGPLFVRAVDASPLTIAFWRNWIAVPVMGALAWLSKAPLTWSVFKAAIPGGLAFTVAQVLGFASFQETSLANAALIGAISPVIIVIVAVPMFGERLSLAQVGLVALSMAAVAMFVLDASSGSGASVEGDLLAVGSLLAQTGYLLEMKRNRMADVPSAAYICGVFLLCGIIVTPITLIWGTPVFALDASDWVYLTALALVAGCAGHSLMSWAQKHVNVGVASVMILGTTVVTAVGAWVFFDQELTAAQIAAGAVVLGAISGVLALQLRRHPDDVSLADLAEPPFAE
jgi:drug/metabolite transporter (DMT)-like permease